MEKSIKTLKNSEKAITLIALVITIIVLLILAGISISMLSGDNSILQKAVDAKTETEKAQIIENAQTDILGQQAENEGANITKEQLATILNKYFKTTETTSIPDEVSSEHDLELTTIDEKYNINLSKIFKGNFLAQNNVLTFGERYEDSMIGKTIDYKSANNNVTEWIILGKQVNSQGKNDVIITTKNAVGLLGMSPGLEAWKAYETNVNNACKTYVGETGILGTKSASIKEVRSITLEDINKAVGFNENINTVTISNANGGFSYPNENGMGWVKNTDAGYSSWPAPPATIKEGYRYYYDGTSGRLGSGVGDPDCRTRITLEKSYNISKILNGSYWVASRTAMLRSFGAEFYVAAARRRQGRR